MGHTSFSTKATNLGDGPLAFFLLHRYAHLSADEAKSGSILGGQHLYECRVSLGECDRHHGAYWRGNFRPRAAIWRDLVVGVLVLLDDFFNRGAVLSLRVGGGGLRAAGRNQERRATYDPSHDHRMPHDRDSFQ